MLTSWASCHLIKKQKKKRVFFLLNFTNAVISVMKVNDVHSRKFAEKSRCPIHRFAVATSIRLATLSCRSANAAVICR